MFRKVTIEERVRDARNKNNLNARKQLDLEEKNDELKLEQTMATMELGGAMEILNMQNEVSQAEMLMEIGKLLEQLQGGN